jgi:hypothetical protein
MLIRFLPMAFYRIAIPASSESKSESHLQQLHIQNATVMHTR